MHGVGPGSLLGGRYLVRRRVAQHARYERWSAADQTLDRDVVLLCFAADGPVASAALDAARRAAGVEEHRLVRVLDVGHDPAGVDFVVEEPLTGARSLTATLADGGLPAEEARRVLGETASALERARARGLHHGLLTPRSVFLTDDGGIKVRGLATEAALVESDEASSDDATRVDTTALVGIGYALLTGRWPLPDQDAGLEAAPRVVGGVAAPSEISAGVPADLDLLARTTLAEGRGPQTPGELAEQIGPWSSTPVTAGMPATDLRRRPGTRTEPLDRDRATGGVARDAGRGSGARTVSRGAHTAAAAGLGAAAAAGAGAPRSVLGVPFPAARGPQGQPGAEDDGDQGENSDAAGERTSPVAGVVAAGGAVARRMGTAFGAAGGLASGVGDKVGGMARGAADRAADRAAERSASKAERRQAERYEDPGVFGENVRLSEALDASEDELEPALPLLPGAAQEPLDRDQSRLALVVIAAFVVVAAALGLWGLPKLSGIGTTSGSAAPVVTKTVTAGPSDTPSAAPSTTATPTPSAQPIAIASLSQISKDGGVQAGKGIDVITDGNPDTTWRASKWYATPQYGGYTDSQVGLLLGLAQPSDVHTVTFTVKGPADVSVLVNDTPKVEGATTVGTVSGQDGQATVTVPNGGAVKGQYVILWFGTLGPDGPGRYRAQIGEVSIT